jgi:hypothetical protein
MVVKKKYRARGRVARVRAVVTERQRLLQSSLHAMQYSA